jgi:hypothetical protein
LKEMLARHDAFVSKLGLGKQQARAALAPLSAEIAPEAVRKASKVVDGGERRNGAC